MPARKEKGFELLRKQIVKSFSLGGNSQIPSDLNDLISSLLKENNSYGLVWEDKTSREIFDKKIKDGYIPFIEEIENNKYSKPGNSLGNVIIEGDNYHSLKVLQATHKNKVDVIYIDPPYNTGNGDFKYNDILIDKEDKYRHSKWLAFMQKRLVLANSLLKDTGLIFISIDENEYAQIKLLCDEIFFERNYIDNFVWVKNSTKNNSKLQSNNHEYILCYAKDKQKIQNIEGYFKIKKEGYDDVIGIYKEMKKNGKSNTEIQNTIKKYYSENPNLKGISSYKNVDDVGIYASEDMSAPGGNGADFDIIHPTKELPCKKSTRGWGFSYETYQDRLKNNLIIFGKNCSTVPRLKKYLENLETEVLKSVIVDNRDGIKDLQEILPNCDFNNPKPVSLIKKLISTHPKNDILVLDFFGGSGTTGQAVLELNETLGGNRKFIICTNNEVSDEGNKNYLIKNLSSIYNVDIKSVWNTLKSKQEALLEKHLLNKKEPSKLSKSFIQSVLTKEGFVWNEEDYQSNGICRDITHKRLKKVIDKSFGSLSYFLVDFHNSDKKYETESELLGDTDLQEKYVNYIDGLITLKENVQDYVFVKKTKSFSIYKNSKKQIVIVKQQIYKDIETTLEIKNCLDSKLETIIYFFFPDFDESNDEKESDNTFKKFFSTNLNISIDKVVSIPKEYIKKIIKGEFKI